MTKVQLYTYLLLLALDTSWAIENNRVWTSEDDQLSLSPNLKMYQQQTIILHGEFNKTFQNFVNAEREIIYEFNYRELENQTTAVRISAKLLSQSQPDFPLLVVVRQQQRIVSWQLPLYLEYLYPYKSVSRTLCPMDQINRQQLSLNQTIYVDISTMYQNNDTEFSLEASYVTDFIIKTNVMQSLRVSPSEPVYYMYQFPKNIDSVIVHATSEDDLCMVLSIQDVMCPVFDLNRDVQFQGMYQTMSKQAAIPVEKKNYEEEAFFIVFVLKTKDVDCSGIESIRPAGFQRIKNVQFNVYGTISAAKYYVAIIVAVAVFVGFYLVAITIGIFFHGCDKNRGIWMVMIDDEQQQNLIDEDRRSVRQDIHNHRSYGSIPESTGDVEVRYKEMTDSPNHNPAVAETKSQDSVNMDDIDDLPDAEEEKDVFRTKTVLFVSDLSRKQYKRQHKKYNIYWRNLVAISIFYGLPVLQLVFTYQKVLHVTGDLDICYYNFNCAHPLGLVTSFNNIFSNIGYVLLGLLFLLIVWRRNIIYNKAVEKSPSKSEQYGIPQHFGLFYSMGIALMMEGVMSACYHVCPTYSNFQFDTSFMYIIACLCILKIYQTRHPDISAKAHTSFIVMAVVIFIAVIGVVYGNSIFWILFALVDMLFYLLLSIHIYYLGRWKIDRGVGRRLFVLFRYEIISCGRPMYLDRLVLLVIGTILNWSFVIYGAVSKPSDFASFLLGLFIGNLMLYCIFYVTMKIRHKETIPLLSILIILSAIIVWFAALYFFFSHLTSWQLTPAMSREGNRNCIVLEFYDAHDIWHFLSAIALFFSFLVLLTLDDAQFSVRRDKIHVF